MNSGLIAESVKIAIEYIGMELHYKKSF